MGAISIWHTYRLTWHTYRTNTWTSSHAEYIKARPNRFQKVTGILFAHSSYTKSLPKIDHVHDLSDHMEESRLWFWRARSYFPLIKIKGCFNFDSLRVKLSSLWPLLLFFTKSINIRYKLLDAKEKSTSDTHKYCYDKRNMVPYNFCLSIHLLDYFATS